jgi:hypothetical protein
MGRLLYGTGRDGLEIEDRDLAHLQLVMVAKLRRSESFAFIWTPPHESGEGRSVLWINPSQYIQFKFYGTRQPTINRRWVEELMVAANSVAGLRLVVEPDPLAAGSAEA